MSNTESFHWRNVRNMCLNPSARDYDVSALSDAVTQVIDGVGVDMLPDSIASAVEKGYFSFDEGVLLLGVASYSTDDEGARIQHVLEHWLEVGVDVIRVDLALSHDTFPFRSRAQRVAVLTRIAKRFPQFADKCRHLIETSRE
ncbi:hypothetical protein [Polyangium fumosum]|uniref:Uncharacterized protein n=1 Tax=Polyangium fumosum TaxID=889272 RepID=A0A4U1IL69_9BACT|nr:hypothetical protein [Polyangium fumosum]TKC94643.1 hypothetical protein E8A74_47960 [Polyangium fumosum]